MALLQTLGPAVQTLAPAAQFPTPYTVGPFAQPLTNEVLPPPPPPGPPVGGGGAGVWCPPEEPDHDPPPDPEVLARIVWDTVEKWNEEVRQTSTDLAVMVGLKAFPGGESKGTQLAAVVALVVDEEGNEDES